MRVRIWFDDLVSLVEGRVNTIVLVTCEHELCGHASHDYQQRRDQEKTDRDHCGVSPHKLAAAVNR